MPSTAIRIAELTRENAELRGQVKELEFDIEILKGRIDDLESAEADPLQRIRTLLEIGDTDYVETLIHREIGA